MIDYLDHVAELDAEVARLQAKFPKIFKVSPPVALSPTQGQEAQASAAGLPFVSQSDEE